MENKKSVLDAYSFALNLLDDYDHDCINKPKGTKDKVKLSYVNCREFIDSMKYSDTSSVFGVEKEEGKLNGILSAVYQEVFDQEIYSSLEEKAANLLYFLIKDHPFADGCKRIGASLFVEYLSRNNMLYRDDKLIISENALVAITLLIAESRPEEKENIIRLIMNFLSH